MQKSEIHIVVVDDDATFGKACKEALERSGFRATHFSRSEEALSHCKLQAIHGAVIDCMLPKINGRDLVKMMGETLQAKIPTVMVSGIFKDKNFIRETLAATGAQAFFVKPVDVPQLVSTFENSFMDVVDAAINPLHALMLKEELSSGERIRAINEVAQIHCYDLPWVLYLLLQPKISGHLNLISDGNEVSSIGISNGRIVQLNKNDAKSYFGVLLVEHGFVSQAEMDEVMSNSNKSRRVGERLVEANVLSPHAIQIVLSEQQGIRLSSIISNQMVQMNFVSADDLVEDSPIDRLVVLELIDDWIRAKIELDWLKNHYIFWERFTLLKGAEYNANNPVNRLPTMNRIPNFLGLLLSQPTLEAAFQQLLSKFPEADVYQALHMAIITRVVRFGEPVQATNFDLHRNRLKKLKEDLLKQNYFERLGLATKTREGDIKKSFYELAKIMHPDKLPTNSPEDVRTLAKETFNLINEAYETLSSPRAREQYVKDLEHGRAEAVLMAEQLLTQARNSLSRGEAANAIEIIEEAWVLAPPSSEAKMLKAWALLRANSKAPDSVLNAAKELISAVPPEERHNAEYFFVKGLSLNAGGEHEAARKLFENAAAMDPNFVDAKRELNVMTLNRQKSKKTNDIFNADLKDVIGGLFKKR